MKKLTDLLGRNKGLLNKLASEMTITHAVKREKLAETKAMLILEEIAVAMKKKGIKEWNGDNYTLTIR